MNREERPAARIQPQVPVAFGQFRRRVKTKRGLPVERAPSIYHVGAMRLMGVAADCLQVFSGEQSLSGIQERPRQVGPFNLANDHHWEEVLVQKLDGQEAHADPSDASTNLTKLLIGIVGLPQPEMEQGSQPVRRLRC